jgi:hypothetical protein
LLARQEMEIKEFLAQVPRFDQPGPQAERRSFPELLSFADQLRTVRPRHVRAVISVPPRPVRSQRRWLHFLAIAKGYRTDFALIHRLAIDLAPTVLNTGVVPIIEPVHERDLEEMPMNRETFSGVFERGTLLYEWL